MLCLKRLSYEVFLLSKTGLVCSSGRMVEFLCGMERPDRAWCACSYKALPVLHSQSMPCCQQVDPIQSKAAMPKPSLPADIGAGYARLK